LAVGHRHENSAHDVPVNVSFYFQDVKLDMAAPKFHLESVATCFLKIRAGEKPGFKPYLERTGSPDRKQWFAACISKHPTTKLRAKTATHEEPKEIWKENVWNRMLFPQFFQICQLISQGKTTLNVPKRQCPAKG
jgi:hypothetical protein